MAVNVSFSSGPVGEVAVLHKQSSVQIYSGTLLYLPQCERRRFNTAS